MTTYLLLYSVSKDTVSQLTLPNCIRTMAVLEGKNNELRERSWSEDGGASQPALLHERGESATES